MELFLFKDLLVILGFSILVLLIGYRLHIPPVVGFILTGVLAGPHGLALVGETDDVETLAQMGIILLLFGIGMEFSLKKAGADQASFFIGRIASGRLDDLGQLHCRKSIRPPLGRINIFGISPFNEQHSYCSWNP